MTPQYILIMKLGPYCGYSLEEIIDIKQKEEEKVGKFYIGYSGVFCRPHVVKNLVTHAINNNGSVKVLFLETKSAYDTPNANQFTKYSTDYNNWEELDEEILLVGDHSKKHFSLTCKNLEEADFKLDISQYCTMMGQFPNTEQTLDNYYKYRVDKVCGYYKPDEKKESSFVDVKYVCDLVEPYSVYIK